MKQIDERFLKLLENGRLLLLHHRNAEKYYKMNIIFLTVFLGISIQSYRNNAQVFMNEKLGKLYIATILLGMSGLLVFSNRHIKNLYLDPAGKEVIVQTYSLFGLAQGKEKVIKVRNLKGNRIFLTPRLNVYQLEYIKEGKWDKRRSFFYRPEYIGDQDLWQKVRKGTEIGNMLHEKGDEAAEMLKKLKKKAEAKSKYK